MLRARSPEAPPVSPRRGRVAWWLLGLLAAAPVVGDSPCRVELLVKSCMGKPKPNVRLEVEVDGARRSFDADAEGVVRVELCREEIGTIWVYLDEESPPLESRPAWREPAAEEADAAPVDGEVVVC